MPEEKRTLEGFALGIAHCSLEVSHAASVPNSLAKMSYVAPPDYEDTREVRPILYVGSGQGQLFGN